MEEKRHIFMALAIGILFISPVLVLLLPSFVVNSMYNLKGTWGAFVPGAAYIGYAAGFFVLFLGFLIIFLKDVSKSSILICIGCVGLMAAFFYLAVQPHVAFSDETISYRKELLGNKTVYSWEEVEKVTFYTVVDGEGFPEYEFIFQDGNVFNLKESGPVRQVKQAIRSRLSEEGKRLEYER